MNVYLKRLLRNDFESDLCACANPQHWAVAPRSACPPCPPSPWYVQIHVVWRCCAICSGLLQSGLYSSAPPVLSKQWNMLLSMPKVSSTVFLVQIGAVLYLFSPCGQVNKSQEETVKAVCAMTFKPKVMICSV